MSQKIRFIENPAVKGREENYTTLYVRVPEVLDSWKNSLFSFEWLDANQQIKPIEGLAESEKQKRQRIEHILAQGLPVEMPVLGMGMLDNVEIGIGRDIFLTLAANGVTRIPVHIPILHKDDFSPFCDTDE